MFIVLEGIDGAGKGRQRTELAALMKDKVKELYTQDFPNHQGPIYKHLIHPGLHEEIKIPGPAWFLAFALDQALEQDKIAPAVGSAEIYALCDGYFTTNIVYQSIVNNNVPLDEALKFAKQYKIAAPDLGVFVDVDPKVAMERKLAEEGHDEGLDINERDLEKQQKFREGFLKMAKESIFCKWVVIDGSGSIEEVRDQLLAQLRELKIINF